MDVEDSELGDFSEAVRNSTVLMRLSMRRALKGVAQAEYSKAEIVEMGDTAPVPDIDPADIICEKAVNKRLEIADRASRTLADVKMRRLEALEKFKEKAEDKPKPANIVFTRAQTSPTHLIMRYIQFNRIDEAKTVASDHGMDWTKFEKIVEGRKRQAHQQAPQRQGQEEEA